MKISIITVTYNSENTIRDTLNSVLSQTYNNIEHVIVDGGSNDKTLEILNKYSKINKKVFIKKGYGIYKSINFAIKKSTGKYIIILNSDDIFNSDQTLNIIKGVITKNKKTEIFIGNVIYFSKFNYYKVSRFYPSKNFKVWKMKFGLMPPHPGSIIKRETYLKHGMYNDKFKIAGDFELFLRYFKIFKIKYKVIDNILVRMRTGGISGRNFLSYWQSTLEILKSFKINNLNSNLIFIILRFPAKIHQLFLNDKKKLNKDFKFTNFIFDKNHYSKSSFKVLSNINKLDQKKKFILSGVNLAFLGYFSNRDVSLEKSLFHWPDGIWIKNHLDIKKIPGKKLLEKIKLDANIKSITVVGNLSKNSHNYLKKKFKLKINHFNLPYGNIDNLIKNKIKLPKKTLTLITLPTPKQEQFAHHLSKKNRDFKIICIGASVSIASGDEKSVPELLRNFEFLWRLRNDFTRRSKRLIETLYFYIKGRFIYNIFEKVRFIKID